MNFLFAATPVIRTQARELLDNDVKRIIAIIPKKIPMWVCMKQNYKLRKKALIGVFQTTTTFLWWIFHKKYY